jgi:hypothetical protein
VAPEKTVKGVYMELSSGFEFQAMSNVDFEDLIVEVLYQGEFCFLVDQERGFENLHISIHARPNGQPWKISLGGFSDSHQARR